MATMIRRLAASGRDRGAATLWFAVLGLAALACLGLVVDYGGAVTAKQKAQWSADEAARAAGQSVVKPLGVRGDAVMVDPIGAQVAAQDYLRRAQVQGQVTPVAPRVLAVSTQSTYTPVVLSIIGMGPQQVTGHATVNLNHVGADVEGGDGGLADLGDLIEGGPP